VRSLLTTLFTISLVAWCFAQDTAFVNQKAKEVILWTSTGILLVDNCVDGYRYVANDSRAMRIEVCFENSGTADSTLIDIKKVIDDTARTIIGKTNYLKIKGGDNRQCVEFLPDRSVDLNEGEPLRMDILKVATGTPMNFTVSLFVKKGIPRK